MAGIGVRLKGARKRKGWTQPALATRSGVGLVTVRRVEQRDAEPRLATARRLAEALGVRVEWLVFGIGPMVDAADSDAAAGDAEATEAGT